MANLVLNYKNQGAKYFDLTGAHIYFANVLFFIRHPTNEKSDISINPSELQSIMSDSECLFYTICDFLVRNDFAFSTRDHKKFNYLVIKG
jgi:hypothetical protein